jgi:hypothetical protein
MSKSDGKDLTKGNDGEMTIPGAYMPEAFLEAMGDGFATIETIMMGNPADGKMPLYVGVLIGRGDDLEVEAPDSTEKAPKMSMLPTYVFKPMTRKGVVQNVTHIVPASHQIAAACGRILAQMEKDDKTAIVGLQFLGVMKTRKGRQLNRFQVFEKYLDKAEPAKRLTASE